jgi:hypothetical protein
MTSQLPSTIKRQFTHHPHEQGGPLEADTRFLGESVHGQWRLRT